MKRFSEFAAAAQELAEYFTARADALSSWKCCSPHGVSLDLVQFFPATPGDNRESARCAAKALGGSWKCERDHSEFLSWRGALVLPSGRAVLVILHEVERDEIKAVDLEEPHR